MRVGSEIVEALREDVFAKIRNTFGVPEDFLTSNFEFHDLTDGGGKGGTLLSLSNCGNFFVKELSAADGKRLLSADFCEIYAEHIVSQGSLLCRIFSIFLRQKSRKVFIGMGNCLPVSIKRWDYIFDLKGSADDKTLMKGGQSIDEVHKRFWRLDWIILEALGQITKKRIQYVEGKKEAYTRSIFLADNQKTEIMGSLKHDLDFFIDKGVMDYSMIVAIKEMGQNSFISPSENILKHRNIHNFYRFNYAGKSYIIYFGIIDFLQGWTFAKKVAHIIKYIFAPKPISTVHPIKYAKQFEKFFEKKLRTVESTEEEVEVKNKK